MDIVSQFIDEFKDAAGEAAVLEFKTRLLAEKAPALERLAHDGEYNEVEQAILTQFGSDLSPQDSDCLRRSRELRNKLLHCDFHRARKKLTALGVPPQSAGVKQIDIREISGADALALLFGLGAFLSYRFLPGTTAEGEAKAAWDQYEGEWKKEGIEIPRYARYDPGLFISPCRFLNKNPFQGLVFKAYGEEPT